jgi:hypothetical protein
LNEWKKNKRTNKFLTMGVIVYYVWVLGLVWIATIRGIRSAGRLNCYGCFTSVG